LKLEAFSGLKWKLPPDTQPKLQTNCNFKLQTWKQTETNGKQMRHIAASMTD
jgi:hypothetical protein